MAEPGGSAVKPESATSPGEDTSGAGPLKEQTSPRAYRVAADRLIRHPFDTWVDSDAVVTRNSPDGGDDAEGGRWVAAWVFVPDDEVSE